MVPFALEVQKILGVVVKRIFAWDIVDGSCLGLNDKFERETVVRSGMVLKLLSLVRKVGGVSVVVIAVSSYREGFKEYGQDWSEG